VARRRTDHPTELELAILGVIWRDGLSTVRHVRDALAATRDLNYATIATTMNIMVKKRLLSIERRPKSEGGIVFKARVRKTATASKIFEWVARHAFGGSIAQVIQALAQEGKIDLKELEDLRAILPNDKEET
jgi:predicted transcriptional regulator